MKEDYISLETNKLAKEKGFINERTVFESVEKECVDAKGEGIGKYYNSSRIITKEVDTTQDLLRKWLREIYKIQIEIIVEGAYDYPTFFPKVHVPKRTDEEGFCNGEWDGEETIIYEVALEEGLQKGLNAIDLL